jgi:hypothetical protein
MNDLLDKAQKLHRILLSQEIQFQQDLDLARATYHEAYSNYKDTKTMRQELELMLYRKEL